MYVKEDSQVLSGISWVHSLTSEKFILSIAILGNTVTRNHTLNDFKTIEIYSPTVLEAGSPKSNHHQNHAFWKICIRILPCLFLALDDSQQSLVSPDL